MGYLIFNCHRDDDDPFGEHTFLPMLSYHYPNFECFNSYDYEQITDILNRAYDSGSFFELDCLSLEQCLEQLDLDTATKMLFNLAEFEIVFDELKDQTYSIRLNNSFEMKKYMNGG